MKLKLTRVVEGVNMTFTHYLRECFTAKKLKNGECYVAFNSLQTMYKLVFRAAGDLFVISAWADEGLQFDVGSVRSMLDAGLGVTLVTSGADSRKPITWEYPVAA